MSFINRYSLKVTSQAILLALYSSSIIVKQ